MPHPYVIFHIYPTDCDMLGHLNHATMLNFLERARWALLEPQQDLRSWSQGEEFPVVRHVDISYRAQSLPGENLAIRSGLLKVGKTSYTVKQEARKLHDHTIVAEAEIVFVAVNRNGEPVPVPERWTAMLAPWESESPQPEPR